MTYVYDQAPVNPVAKPRSYAEMFTPARNLPMQQSPYGGRVWPAQLTTMPQGASYTKDQLTGLGLIDDQTWRTVKDLMALAGVIALAYWLFFSAKSPLKNPGGLGAANPSAGRNKIVRVTQGAGGGWYYKLMRKRARRQGPYASYDDACAAAEEKGYSILS